MTLFFIFLYIFVDTKEKVTETICHLPYSWCHSYEKHIQVYDAREKEKFFRKCEKGWII